MSRISKPNNDYIVDDSTTTTTTQAEPSKFRTRRYDESMTAKLFLCIWIIIFSYWILLSFMVIFLGSHIIPFLKNLEQGIHRNPYAEFMFALLTLTMYAIVLATYIGYPFVIYKKIDNWDKKRLSIRD